MAHKRKRKQEQLMSLQAEAEEETPPDPKVLLHQNKQLSYRLAEIKGEIRTLEANLFRADRRAASHQGCIALVDTQWSALDDRLAAVLGRFEAFSKEAPAMPPVTDEGEPTSASLLGALLRRPALTDAQVDDDEAGILDTEAGASLLERADATAGLTERVAAAVQRAMHGEGIDNARLVESLQSAAAAEASTNLVRRSAQKALAASELLKEARVRGDEMEEQLENAKRAVKRLTLQLEQRDTQSQSAKPGHAGSDSKDTADERVRDAEDRAEALIKELAKLRADALKLRQKNETLKIEVAAPPQKKILESAMFRALAMEHQTLDTQHSKLSAEYSRLVLEKDAVSETVHARAAAASDAMEKERTRLMEKLRASDREVLALKSKLDGANDKIQNLQSQPDQRKRVQELEILIKNLNGQLKRIKTLQDRPQTEAELKLRQQLATSQRKYEQQKKLLAKEKKQSAELQKAQSQFDAKEEEYRISLSCYQSSMINRDARSAVEAQAKAASEGKALQRQLDEARAEVRALKPEGVAKSADEGSGENENAKEELQQKVEDLSTQLKMRKDDEEGLMAELDELGTSFEELQEQNSRLLQQLKEKDDENYKLLTMRLKGQSKLSLLEEQAAVRERFVATVQVSMQTEVDARTRVMEAYGTIKEQMGQAQAEMRLACSKAQLHETNQQQAFDSLVGIKSQLEVSDRALQEATKSQAKLLSEKTGEERRANELSREMSIVKRKLDVFHKQGVGRTDEMLEDELFSVKRLLRCSIEEGEYKEVVIAREGCYHLFSRKCVDMLIKTRNRKCPVCKCNFDVANVKRIVGLKPDID